MSTPGAATTPDAKTVARLVALGFVVGIPAAFVAWLFLAAVHGVESLLWDEIPDALGTDEPPAYLVVILPVAGALVVWLARRFLPGNGGHRPLDGIGGPPLGWRAAPGVALAALGTLAFGAVLGPEAPLIALGSIVGVVVAEAARVPNPATNVIASAGSFSAVSALFGGPVVASMLVLEGGLASGVTIALLLPGVVAASVGYLLFIGLGTWHGLATSPLVVPGLPAYDGTRVPDVLVAVVVGVLTAVLTSLLWAAAVRMAAWVSRPRRLLIGLVLGGAATGVLALAARGLGADSQDVLFSGQAAVPDLVAEGSVGVLLVLLLAKGLGYAVCLGCGFRGGPVFPAIFLGVAIATLAVVLFDFSPTWAVAVGAAAGMTAGTGLVFSALLFSLLLVGKAGLDAVSAAAFAAAAAWLVRAFLQERLGGKSRAGLA
jgi:H+/Cl- antiporter ClcA